MGDAKTRSKGLRIATRCRTIEQFVDVFQRFSGDRSFFISTLATRPVGLETPFSVDLAGGKPVLRGHGIVLAAFGTTTNPFGRPGVQLGIRRLTQESQRVFDRLLRARARSAAAAAPIVKPRVKERPLPVIEARTPRSPIVLPANPLSDITDRSLEGFIDCSLYEDSGTPRDEASARAARWRSLQAWWPLGLLFALAMLAVVVLLAKK